MIEEWEPFVDRDEEDLSSGYEGVRKYCMLGEDESPGENSTPITQNYSTQIKKFLELFPSYDPKEIIYDQNGVPHIETEGGLSRVEDYIAIKESEIALNAVYAAAEIERKKEEKRRKLQERIENAEKWGPNGTARTQRGSYNEDDFEEGVSVSGFDHNGNMGSYSTHFKRDDDF